MSGDYSRIAFDPWLDDLGVMLEQGRPLTDRDWNDQTLQLNRRIQAGTLDTIGTAVVPMETPEGFKILLSNGSMTIGRGRIYVHGLLAENHGKAPDGGKLDWDPKLAELFGAEPLNYNEQPYYPNPPALPVARRHVAYLDVWQREVTRFVRPELVEPALGVDTTTRLQTVWQVKLLAGNADTTCATPLANLEGWLPEHAPSAGRLTVTTAPVPNQPDPCQVPPTEGYKGLENQLYRLEIHKGGEPGTATFKWSRDNASVEAAVVEIQGLTQIVVDSVGKDDVLRFSEGDWIEITDDWLELHGEPGLLRRIATPNGVDDATRTITLDEALPAGQFPTNQDLPDPDRHTRIRRWDQKHTIFNAAGVEIQDLDDALGDGTITVPADDTQVLLEHNIVVSFSVQPETGQFRSGDYWVFAARAIDASIEELTEAPPRGIHHHYTKLAVVTFPNTEIDCRVFWPPALTGQPPGETIVQECGCTVCVTAESHEDGTLTIQDGIDKVRERGGGTVCLDVGKFSLKEPLIIVDATSLRIVGKGIASEVQSETRVALIDKSQDITLESFTVSVRPPAAPAASAPNAAVVIGGSNDVRLERMTLVIANNNPAWSAIALSGAISGLSVRENTISAAIGLRTADATGGETGLTDLRIDDNGFQCVTAAMRLSGITIHQFVSYIRGNRIAGCDEAGVFLEGRTVPGHSVEISGNTFAVQGRGVIAGLDGLRVMNNDILQAEAPAKDQVGVELRPSPANDEALDHVQIIGNRISGFRGAAVHGRVKGARFWTIAGNHVEGGRNGFVLEADRCEQVVIENNHLTGIEGFGVRGQGLAATLTVAGNQIQVRSREPAVFMVFEDGDTIFSGNHVARSGGAADSADVVLACKTIVADGNRVRESARLSMEIKTDKDNYTVLGNICNGIIRVNGTAVTAPPWAALNRQSI